MWTQFEIVSARSIDCGKKYIMYNIEIHNRKGNDTQPIFIEKRYTDFLELYNTLRQKFPALTSSISFPRKLILGNFSPETIKTRLIGLEIFLEIISENNTLLDSTGFRMFLVGHEEKCVKKFIEGKKYSQAKPLLGKIFKILNKVYTERHPAVILALCRLIACCSTDPASLEEASKYAEIALRRFDGISDVDLLHYYVPLLQMCVQLWDLLGKDKEFLERELTTLRCKGHRVDGCQSLLESIPFMVIE